MKFDIKFIEVKPSIPKQQTQLITHTHTTKHETTKNFWINDIIGAPKTTNELKFKPKLSKEYPSFRYRELDLSLEHPNKTLGFHVCLSEQEVQRLQK